MVYHCCRKNNKKNNKSPSSIHVKLSYTVTPLPSSLVQGNTLFDIVLNKFLPGARIYTTCIEHQTFASLEIDLQLIISVPPYQSSGTQESGSGTYIMPSDPFCISFDATFDGHYEKICSNVEVQVSAISTPERLETPEDSEDDTRYLLVSPYTEKPHLLDLDSVDVENQLLAQALVYMNNVRDDFRTASYQDSFNWHEIIQHLRRLNQRQGHDWKETSFYIVAFRSQIKPDADYSHLVELDRYAHAEATASGGFLK